MNELNWHAALEAMAKNLSQWRGEQMPRAELCRLQYAALARYAAEAYQAGLWRDLSELGSALTVLSRTAEAPDGATLTPTALAATVEERLAFCRELLALLPELWQTEEHASEPVTGAIALLDNPFFRAAAKRFAPLTAGSATLILPAFADICEAVARGDARFGILPLEDSADGKLFHFYEQIDRYELRISHTTDVPYPDGTKVLRFALLYRAHPPTASAEGEGMLECSLFGETRGALVELLDAALAGGLSLRRVDALPAPYGEDGFFYRPTFRTSAGEPRLFEAYLSCFMPRAAITARYTHLPQEAPDITNERKR